MELKLEVAPPFPRAGSSDPLWHRVRVTNKSCLQFPSFPASDIMDSGRRMAISIRNATGQEIPRRKKEETREETKQIPDALRDALTPGYSWVGPIELYSIEAPESLYIALDRQRHVESSSAILAPYRPRETAVDYMMRDEGRNGGIAHGTFFDRMRVPIPRGTPTPPPGFQPVERAWFPKPGRYSMTVRLEGKHYGRTPLPRVDPLPGWLQSRLYSLGLAEGRYSELDIRTRSNAVEFEIGR